MGHDCPKNTRGRAFAQRRTTQDLNYLAFNYQNHFELIVDRRLFSAGLFHWYLLFYASRSSILHW